MNKLKGFAKFLFVLFILIFMVVVGGVSAVYYENWERNMKEDNSKLAQFLSTSTKNSTKQEVVIEPNFTCLFMGRNQHLTDFIMLGQYNPNTREVSLLSIPRDTYVDKSSVDGKINSIYMGKYPEKVVNKVSEITGIEIDYYVVFDTKVLRNIIDELGGVTINVPINMNYDDPYQNLYIHLKKGVQKLTGAQAEQFVRFRKNNDGTGYANGDIGRIQAQHEFIKAVASEILKAENIGKIGNLVKIVLDGTKTDITMDVISEYIDDVVTFKTDRIRIETLPGVGRYDKGPDGLTRSYYFIDENKAKNTIQNLFFTPAVSGDNANVSGDTVNKEINDKKEEVFSSSLETNDERAEVRVEVLSAKASSTKFNELVEKLKENGCNVVKIGNYSSDKVESSRIITYGKNTEEELKKIKELSGISKVEESNEESAVKFSIIIGANYK